MKTPISKSIIAVIIALAITAVGTADVYAEGKSGLIYNNRAYTHGTESYPNQEADRFVREAKIVYVNIGYGPAIYSYPNNNSQVEPFLR